MSEALTEPAVRDQRGRFVRGNPGGPGNPHARRVARLRSALLDAVGDAGLAEVAQALVQAAKSGDVAAAKLLLSYTLGQPGPAVDPDGLDAHEAELAARLRECEDAEQFATVLAGLFGHD